MKAVQLKETEGGYSVRPRPLRGPVRQAPGREAAVELVLADGETQGNSILKEKQTKILTLGKQELAQLLKLW